MNQIAIGNFIAKKRKEQNLTQEQLAEKLGVSRQAISKWEGGLSTPELDKLRALSECLLQCTKDYNKNGLPTYNFYALPKSGISFF